MTVSENLPHVLAESHPLKISFPSIMTTCSLPITEVKAVFLFPIMLAEFCYFLCKFELFHGEIHSRVLPHDVHTTVMQWHGLKESVRKGHWKFALQISG